MQASQLGVLLADAQAKSSAAAGTANGTGSKAKAGKVVFGATGNRLLDKQQANNAAKAPAPKPEVTLLYILTVSVSSHCVPLPQSSCHCNHCETRVALHESGPD